jgi:peptide/nickel transport system permease protein
MNVIHYLGRRVLFAVFLVFFVASSALLLTRLAPGDFVSQQPGAIGKAGTLAAERERHGLDRTPIEQYGAWLARAVRFDLGVSLLYGRPVRELVAERAGNTALLAASALLLATFVGMPLGVVSGSRRGPAAALIRGASIVALSLPPLLTSLLLVFVAARSGWAPIGGMTSIELVSSGWGAWFADVARHLPVPALSLALPVAAMLERLQSQSMAHAAGEPFVLAALARGVPLGRVIWRDALRLALQPVAAVYGFVIAGLLSGSFIVEIVTAWPGLGRLMYDALRARDLYLVAGCAAAGAVFLAIGSLVSDTALAAADPRVRRRE